MMSALLAVTSRTSRTKIQELFGQLEWPNPKFFN